MFVNARSGLLIGLLIWMVCGNVSAQVHDLKIVRHYQPFTNFGDTLITSITHNPTNNDIYATSKGGLFIIKNDSSKLIINLGSFCGGRPYGWFIDSKFIKNNNRLYLLSIAHVGYYNNLNELWSTREIQTIKNGDLVGSYSMTLQNQTIWVCSGFRGTTSRDGGLIKLDATTLIIQQIYTRSSGNFPARMCFEALVDSARNNLWVATDEGLWVVSLSTNLSTEHWTKIADGNFSSVQWNEDKTQILATGYYSTNKGLYFINPENLNYTKDTQTGSGPYCLIEYEENLFFIGRSADHGAYYNFWETPTLLCRQNNVWHTLNSSGTDWVEYSYSSPYYPFGGVLDIIKDKNGDLWLATLRGIYQLSTRPAKPILESFAMDTASVDTARLAMSLNATLGLPDHFDDLNMETRTVIRYEGGAEQSKTCLFGPDTPPEALQRHITVSDTLTKADMPVEVVFSYRSLDAASGDSSDWGSRTAFVEKPLPSVTGELTGLPVYPNPYLGEGDLNIPVILTETSDVTLTVYDLMGRIIREENFGSLKGEQTLTWDGLDLAGQRPASGIYLIAVKRMREGIKSKTVVRKCVVIR